MSEAHDLSDKALAVFAFAAYHQLTSGQPVTSVVREDGNGHKAPDDAVDELAASGLVEPDGGDIHFSEDGLRALDAAIAGLKDAVRAG